MNEVIKNILTRRSVRAYKSEQIFDNDLNEILESAKYAPSGSNSQSWHFTVLQNKEKLEKLNYLVKEALKNMQVDEKTYPIKRALKKEAQNDKYNFYYNAPTLIIVSNDREYSNSMADCSTSLENIFLSAHSIGLGSCWINQLCWFCDEPDIRKLLNEFGIPENYVVCGAASVGYNSGSDKEPSARKEGTVTIIK